MISMSQPSYLANTKQHCAGRAVGAFSLGVCADHEHHSFGALFWVTVLGRLLKPEPPSSHDAASITEAEGFA